MDYPTQSLVVYPKYSSQAKLKGNHIVPLQSEHLGKLLAECHIGIAATALQQAYFSPGSVAYCILSEGEPVFAAGIVNMDWGRGEAWILPTVFFHRHVKECYRAIKTMIGVAAMVGHFKRVQATCTVMVSVSLFEHLGFEREGILKHFGPGGEDCHLYALIVKGVK